MALGREEVFRAAVQLEEDGRKFYLETAGRSSDPIVRKTFESLAEDELRHIKWLERIFQGKVPEVVPPQEVYDRLRSIFVEAPREVRRSASGVQSDIDAFKVALGMEDRSIEVYKELAEGTDDEELRSIYERFAEQERIHRSAIENTMEYLEHPVDWFAREEKWIYEGGP